MCSADFYHSSIIVSICGDIKLSKGLSMQLGVLIYGSPYNQLAEVMFELTSYMVGARLSRCLGICIDTQDQIDWVHCDK